MTTFDRLRTAREILSRFSIATGLRGTNQPRRYLWTDAHAVCAYLSVHILALNDPEDTLSLAADLIDQVHSILGRYHPQDSRKGWISGREGQDGAEHPTISGLRIGKTLPERSIGDVYDPQLEWDRDGQYYHYLTRWMHALHQMAIVSGGERYRRWAEELAVAAYKGFRVVSSRRLHWKMSTDLSRPLVNSSGLHDPLDGLVTALVLESRCTDDANRSELQLVIEDLYRMCARRSWDSDDPLGIGGLLFDGYRLARLPNLRSERLLDDVLGAAERGLECIVMNQELQRPPAVRLPFRELGLAIGLHAAEHMCALTGTHKGRMDCFRKYFGLAREIEEFWLQDVHQRGRTWTEHEDINAVMLATSLIPEAFLSNM